MVRLYHCGLGGGPVSNMDIESTTSKPPEVGCNQAEDLPVQRVVGIARWGGYEDNFIGLVVTKSDISHCGQRYPVFDSCTVPGPQ